MIESIERMRKLVNDNLVMNLRFQMNRELNKLEREIEQELNSRAERTCEFNIKDNMNETEGMGDVWIECSTCHCVFDFYADEWLMKMSYCPHCGAKVVGE